MEIMQAKQQVIRAGIELSHSGLIARTWGNVSARTGEDEFAITASGKDYLTLTPEEVVQVKLSDLSYEGEIKPSSEMKVHREIYRLKPDAEFVIHTHQSNASAVSAMGLSEITFTKEWQGIGTKVLIGDYGLPGSKKLCRNTAKAVAASIGNAVIMRNHGAVCWGRSYEEAFEAAHALEEACGEYLKEIGVTPWKKEHTEYGVWNTDPCIMKYMEVRNVLKPYLDDFAQLVGPKLPIIDEDDDVIQDAIAEGTPLLVRGKGALCVGKTEDDAQAFRMVIEKNCRAALAAIRSKPIGRIESHMMRRFFLKKYSKLKD